MKNEWYWLIAYDIRHPRRLARVAKCLSSYGWRIQKSVFEAHLTEDQMDRLEKRLRVLICDEDFIFILPICEEDKKKRKIYGLTGSTDPMAETCMIL